MRRTLHGFSSTPTATFSIAAAAALTITLCCIARVATGSVATRKWRAPEGFTGRSYIKICSTNLESLHAYARSRGGRPDGSFSSKCRSCSPCHRFVIDDKELSTLHKLGAGLIYNDFSGLGSTGAKYNVLHKADCHWVLRSNTNVRKVLFDTLVDATRWLVGNRGAEGENWKRCGTCRGGDHTSPVSMLAPAKPHAPYPAQIGGEQLEPFTEGRVEDALIPWLQAQGFEVRKRVRVHNGIIDLVAHRQEEEWVVEAKGEDKGGFNSAEMNFRIGIAQICSRMERNVSKRYGLAIPLTRHFRRVLLKHMNFGVFEQMGLWMYVVCEDGSITELSPGTVQSFVDGLRA